MSQPSDYTPNEAWIVFQLSETPIRTDQEGDFHIIGLMDAASCYILGNEFLTTEAAEVPEVIAEQLIEAGKDLAGILPKKLLLSSALGAAEFERLAIRVGITAEWVPDKELSPFLSEARTSFREHFEKR